MARHKRCVVKRGRKKEEKRRKREEKREEKERKNEDQIAKQNIKKSPCASFSSAQSSFYFGSIRNTLFREKHTIFIFICFFLFCFVFVFFLFFSHKMFSMNELCDLQDL